MGDVAQGAVTAAEPCPDPVRDLTANRVIGVVHADHPNDACNERLCHQVLTARGGTGLQSRRNDEDPPLAWWGAPCQSAHTGGLAHDDE